uniref:Histidine phosphatase family protein n=1 Tax=uncultured Thiotrichaceae bacterium TaxID=298394 RepID=A0A6S6UMB5_9GAMM|nr:MAG: Unknown protein [uncultured Thiotrichaceae bacterium]
MSEKPTEEENPVTEYNLRAQSKKEPLKSEDSDAVRLIPKPLPLTIDLLRHGQVATPSLFSAPFEEPLGMEGWKQLTVATQGSEWDVIIAPPIRRCHDFARLLAQRLDCEFVVDKRFCELDFGEWIGLSQREIIARDPELLKQYYFQPRRFYAPGGESMDDFTTRVNQGWDDLLATYAEKRVLILTHSGVVRALLGKALDLLYQKTLRFEVGYARFTRFSVYPDGEVVLTGHGLPSLPESENL